MAQLEGSGGKQGSLRFFQGPDSIHWAHNCIRKNCGNDVFGLPGMSVHDTQAWSSEFNDEGYTRYFFNTYWEDLDASLPTLPEDCGYGWVLAADTFLERPFETQHERCYGGFRIGARSVRIYEAVLLK